MARLTNALLGQNAYGTDSKADMLDITYGGQFGYTPNLTEWVSNQAYMRRNLICKVLETPRFFNYMPNPEKWVASLKSLLELHARTIEGFNAHLKVDTDEHPVGGAGEMQEEPTNVTREPSNPSFTFVEKYGMPIQKFLDSWIRYGIQDPNTKFALVGTLDSSNFPSDMLADMYSATCIFIEPDATHRRVQKSWITTNMFPKGMGEITGKRDITSASEVTTLSVEFAGISQFSFGTDVFAQTILDQINLVNANPYLQPSFVQSVSSDVTAATRGYVEDINTLSKEAASLKSSS